MLWRRLAAVAAVRVSAFGMRTKSFTFSTSYQAFEQAHSCLSVAQDMERSLKAERVMREGIAQESQNRNNALLNYPEGHKTASTTFSSDGDL